MQGTSTRPDVFCKKGVPNNFSKFTGKHLCYSLLFSKVLGLRPFIKKGTKLNILIRFLHSTNIRIQKTKFGADCFYKRLYKMV